MKLCKAGLHQYDPIPGSKYGCKECNKLRSTAWAVSNKDKRKAICKKYADANKDAITEYNRQYRAAHKDEEAARKKDYRLRNAQKIRDINRAWRLRRKDLTAAQSKRKSEELRDGYVRMSMRWKNAPHEVVAVKRIQIQILRQLKEMTA